MKKTFFGAAVLAAVLFTACGGKDSPATVDCTGSTPTYTANVKEIFDNNCAMGGCHSSADKQKGYDLESYSGAKSAATTKKTSLLGSINHSSGYTKMPQAPLAKLSDADIKLITCWAENGAPE